MEKRSKRKTEELKKLHREIVYKKRNLKSLEELDLNYKNLLYLQNIKKLNFINIPTFTKDGIFYFINKEENIISYFKIM